MIPVAFDYQRVTSVDEALGLLATHGDEAKLLAGGHSLLPLMKLRLAVPAVLVDVGRLRELSYVRDGGDHVAIGALTRHRDLETSELLAAQVPILAHVAGLVGDPQVRHRGTIGGSLAHGDPASDLPAVVLALGGTLVARGPGGERTIPALSFFEGFLQTFCTSDPSAVPRDLPVQEPSIHAFNPATGTVQWQGYASQSFGPTTLAGGMSFVGTGIARSIQVRDASNGVLIHTIPLPAPSDSGVSVVGKSIFFGTGSSEQAAPTGVFAFSAPG